MAIKWRVPLGDLARDLPTVHRLVASHDDDAPIVRDDFSTDMWNDDNSNDRDRFTLMNIRDIHSSQLLNSSNGEEGLNTPVSLYFEFPLDDNKGIELVDSRESYQTACASLKVVIELSRSKGVRS